MARDLLSNGLPWLSVSGHRIVSAETGQPILLRGVNRSGLEHSEPLENSERPFTDAARISERDIQEIASWGAHIIRLPFNQEWVLQGRGGRSAAEYLEALDGVIYWAARAGAYTLLDLQWLSADRVFGPPGSGQRVAPLPNTDSIALWMILARRYQDEPAVLYDLFNEPHDPIPGDPNPLQGIRADGSTFTMPNGRVTMSEWQPWARHLIDAIRSEHPHALIFVSGINWGYDLRGFPLTVADDRFEEYANLVYSTHIYPSKGPPSRPGRTERWPGPAGNPSWQQAFGHLAGRVPVFAGEWGVAEGNEDTDKDLRWAAQLVEYLDQLQMGWTAWSWYDRPYLIRENSAQPYDPTRYGRLVARYLAEP